MSSRIIPTRPPDMTSVLLSILNSATLPGGATVSNRRTSTPRQVIVRADLQNHATPISRYCRVGLTVFYKDANGNARTDLGFDVAATAASAIIASRHPAIVSAEWQSGPLETIDEISQEPVSYITLLLEVASTV